MLAARLLDSAKANKISIDSNIVAASGKKFLEASASDQNLVPVAEKFLDYRSVLNAKLIPDLAITRPVVVGYRSRFLILAPSGETNEETASTYSARLVGIAPPQSAARMELLDKPEASSSGAQFIVYELFRPDNELSLDGAYLRNVIIKNSTVVYKGGPTHLENVYFVNCRFDISTQANVQEFASAVLSSTPTDFQVPVPFTTGAKPGI